MDIEKRCIEFIPEEERYGTPRRMFTMWFSSNLQVTTLVVGTLGVVNGLGLVWTCAALVAGCLVGSIFMAAHSAQGPHLGIPQMIQSRAQFGVVGAGVPLLVVLLAYILFTAANAVVMRDSLKAVLPVDDRGAIVGFGFATLGIAFIGYELIHRIGAILTFVSGGIFLVAALLLFAKPLPPDAWTMQAEAFKPAVFMLVASQAASWTLGFGPYVADYSRYLPSSVSTRQTFRYTYIGNVVGAGAMMLLGAVLAATLADVSHDVAVNLGGSIAVLFGGASTAAYWIIIVGVLQINVLNLYSAFMSSTTIFTGWRGMHFVSRGMKFAVMAIIAVLATLIALATQYRFVEYFTDILIAQIYFLVPWSSINLVDYYFVRKGWYSVPDIFDADGIYGSCNWVTLRIFLLAAVIQIPFMQLSFYTGPIARLIGADIAWIPALLVPGILYYLAMRSRSSVAGVAVRTSPSPRA
jgi:NCS1 family nucleobase:cation symporter-1